MSRKTVLITGASRGIGKSIALEFAKENYDIIATYNQSKTQIETLKEKIKQDYKKDIQIVQVNLENPEEIKKMFHYIEENFAPIDILINNAAIAIDTFLEDKKESDFQKILNVNLIAPFLLSKYYGQKMYERKQGKIINITSTNGIDTMYPEGMDYDASKAALINLTKNFAQAYAPYVQVNAVAPGWVNTEMNKELSPEFRETEEREILLQRFAEPEEIAKVVKFLASEEASYINGTIIRVDGGKK